jgi:hypothetical protein
MLKQVWENPINFPFSVLIPISYLSYWCVLSLYNVPVHKPVIPASLLTFDWASRDNGKIKSVSNDFNNRIAGFGLRLCYQRIIKCFIFPSNYIYLLNEPVNDTIKKAAEKNSAALHSINSIFDISTSEIYSTRSWKLKTPHCSWFLSCSSAKY